MAHRRASIHTFVALTCVLCARRIADAQSASSAPPASPAVLPETAATHPAEVETAASSTSAAALPAGRTQASSSNTITLRSGAAVESDGTLTLSVGPLSITPRAYVETYYSYNFNQPSNGITNERGFDNRHNTFSIANAVLDLQATLASVVTMRVAAQVGSTPDTYYLAEPSAPGTMSVSGSNASTWKYLQQAYLSWTTPLGRGLRIEGGLFLSPIGIEYMAVHSNYNWSRSNLFFGLPFYHAGARLYYPFTDRLRATVAVWNGWNNILDNNAFKSMSVQAEYEGDRFFVNLLYFGGVERNPGSAEGDAWRSLFDLTFSVRPHDRIELQAEANAGFEPNRLGTDAWAAGAIYARVTPISFLRLAVRGDFFAEFVPNDSNATAIFWNGARWVSSGTGTIEFRGFDHVSLRLEYRFDACDPSHPLYFHHNVGTRMDGTFVTNAATQQTLTLGATAWF